MAVLWLVLFSQEEETVVPSLALPARQLDMEAPSGWRDPGAEMGPLAILCHSQCHPQHHPTRMQGCDSPAHGCACAQSSDKPLGSSGFPGHPTLYHGAHRSRGACVKPQHSPTASTCSTSTAPGPEERAGGHISWSRGGPATLAGSMLGCRHSLCPASHLGSGCLDPKAGVQLPARNQSCFPSPLPLCVFRKREWLRERQVCKQFSQLPSGQAPVLLACKEILKQYI